MNYEGHRKTLILKGVKAGTSFVTGLVTAQRVKGAIFVIDVESVTAGSITDLKLRIRSTLGRNEGAATDFIVVQSFAALAIAAKGVYALPIMPGGAAAGGGALGFTKAAIQGYLPPEFEIEIVQAGGSNLTWQLDALWLP